MPIFYMIVFHWAARKPVSVMTVFSQLVAIFVLAGGFWLMIDMLLMKDFKLYNDRIIKTYWFFGRREIILERSDIIIANKLSGRTVYIYERGDYFKRFTKRVYFDFNIGSSKSLERFKDACKQINYEFEKNSHGLKGIKINNK